MPPVSGAVRAKHVVEDGGADPGILHLNFICTLPSRFHGGQELLRAILPGLDGRGIGSRAELHGGPGTDDLIFRDELRLRRMLLGRRVQYDGPVDLPCLRRVRRVRHVETTSFIVVPRLAGIQHREIFQEGSHLLEFFLDVQQSRGRDIREDDDIVHDDVPFRPGVPLVLCGREVQELDQVGLEGPDLIRNAELDPRALTRVLESVLLFGSVRLAEPVEAGQLLALSVKPSDNRSGSGLASLLNRDDLMEF